MKRILWGLLLALTLSGAGAAGEDAGAPGRRVPFRVATLDDFAAFVKDWGDESMPHYSIITNLGEWQSVFSPAAAMGDKRPYSPNPALFERAILVSISRVSDAPAPGEKVLVVKSVAIENGELVLTYNFVPPAAPAGFKVKNTLLVALPGEYVDNLRIIEETETAGSRAADAELEAAKAAGRYKPPAAPRP